jgi:hypothetical protein
MPTLLVVSGGVMPTGSLRVLGLAIPHWQAMSPQICRVIPITQVIYQWKYVFKATWQNLDVAAINNITSTSLSDCFYLSIHNWLIDINKPLQTNLRLVFPCLFR